MKLEISFPVKILLAIGVAVALTGLFFFTRWVAQGTVLFTSTVPGAFVVDTETEVLHPVPAKLTKRTGRHMITFGAPGYASRDAHVTFPVFRFSKRMEFSLDKQLYEEENPNLRQQVPLGDVLPRRTDHFAIEFPGQDGTYTITLYAILNDLSGYEEYQSQLNAYGQEALAWIRSHNVKPEDLKIRWSPERPSAITIGESAAPE